MLPCCIALSCRPKCPAIAGSLFSEHLVADIPRNCNRVPQLEIERDFSTHSTSLRARLSVRNDTMLNLACIWCAQSHIDQKLTLKPAEAGASLGPPMDALLTSKCLKFIGSEVEWVETSLTTRCNCKLIARSPNTQSVATRD